MSLSDHNWRGYGKPGVPDPSFRARMANPAAEMQRIARMLRTDGLIVRHLHPLVARPNPGGVWLHEHHAERAEARLAREGIKPELTAYLAGKTYGG